MKPLVRTAHRAQGRGGRVARVRDARSGAVLPAAVLLGLASVMVCHAALVLAEAELRASSSRVELAMADAATRAAITAAVTDTVPAAARAAGVGVATPIGSRPGSSVRLALRRLGGDVWLVEGRVPVRSAMRAVALPVWVLDPGGPGGPRLGPAGVTSGPWRLGPVDAVGLSSLLEERLLGPLAVPEPVERAGRCVTGVPLNWGDPTGRVPACRTHRVALSVPMSLAIQGGAGQGIVVVGGDVELRGTVFDGVLIATGQVVVGPDTQVTGWVHGEAGVVVDPRGTVTPSLNSAVRALTHPSLRVPIVVGPVRWLTPPR